MKYIRENTPFAKLLFEKLFSSETAPDNEKA
jgi:hypothetical protein